MTDIPFVVIYHSDQDVPTQSDVDGPLVSWR